MGGEEGAVQDRARALPWILSVAVFLLGCLPFLPALDQGFVDLDDDVNFVANAAWRGLEEENVEWMFSTSHVGHYQPLTWLTFGWEWERSGIEDADGFDEAEQDRIARAFHRTNVVLHGLNAVLVLWLCIALVGRAVPGARASPALLGGAALGALFFAVHPLRVESVAWATERRDLLSGLFLFASVLAYLRAVRGDRLAWGWMLAALAGYVLSLLSKAWGITLPVVLLALDVFPLRRLGRVDWKRLVAEKAAFLPLAGYAAYKAAKAQGEAMAVMPLDEHGVLQRFAQACYGVVFYVRKTVLPDDLAALYLLELDFDPLRPVYLASMAATVAVTAALWWARRRFPAGATAWFCYVVIVSPVLGILQSGTQKVADRYSYLSCVPFAVLVAAGLALAARRRGPAVFGGFAVVLLLFGRAAWTQTRTWRDSEALFRNIVEVEPHNYFAHHNLSITLHRERRYAEAIEFARASVEAHPGKGNEEARYNLGMLLRRTGDRDAALEAFRGAIEVEPEHLNSLRAVVGELVRRGEEGEARAVLESVVERRPGFVAGYRELANLYGRLGERARVVELWRRAAAASPRDPAALNGLGRALLDAGNIREAEDYLLRAHRMDTFDAGYVKDVARLFLAQGRVPDAVGILNQVVQRDPNDGEARALLQQAQRR